jgi:glycosyltransferase involved in cell wall biosynthesis
LKIALDATYSAGANLTGVGLYSREILWGLAHAHPETRWLFYYRPHRVLRSLASILPPAASRRILLDLLPPRSAKLFHGLNQRLPLGRLRRTVSTFHDLFVLTADYSTPEFRERFAAQARDAASRSDLIIAVSAFTAGQVESLLGVERARLRVIHHGVHLPQAPEPPREREKIILHVGAIQRRKNLIRLIQAFERLGDDWRLVLAGSGGYEAEEVFNRIEESPRRENIAVTGYVSRSALGDLYARATVFAFPSLDEGFGMPILEAMAAGVPVVSSNRPAMAEVAGDAAILVDPTNVEELTHGIQTVIEQAGLRRLLCERGKQRAQQWTWRDAIEKTWSVYQELL